jgi:hypothetical protein
MRLSHFSLGALAVWRITHLLHAEDGPWDVAARLRRNARGHFWTGLLECFYCLSLWIAAPLACVVGRGWRERLLLWPALSAGAIAVERLMEGRPGDPPAWYHEDPEGGDALLRQADGLDPAGG